ncbi:MAG: S8 family serine peptidase [Anaerolineae bacterium]|nr:S8 family serine peptidase [Anaerolineae bacterium]
MNRSNIRYRIFRIIVMVMVTIGLAVSVSRSPVLAQSPHGADEVRVALATTPSVRVIVALQPPSQGAEVRVQTQEVQDRQTRIMETVPEPELKVLHRYHTVAGLSGEVTAAGLEALVAHPEVMSVALDLPVEATLTESAAFIHADAVHQNLGITGAGVNVAVLDTGVDLAHPDLASKVVAQHCFNRGSCPSGATDEGDSAQDENGHGTHVSGIIVSQGSQSPRGIAPDAGLVAVRVLGSSGVGFSSDVIAGIDWVVANQASLNVTAINLSLGGGAYEGVCDQADANTMLYAAATTAARNAGIAVFAASGNGAEANKMTTPACVSSVIAVGNVYDTASGSFNWGSCLDELVTADQVACSSNSSAELDLLAPGVLISSTNLGGGQSTKSGTSMATPHAAAVAALLAQANPSLTAADIETVLENSGVPVTDSRSGRVVPRIDALAAVSQVITNETVTFSGTILLQGRTDHSGTSIFLTEDSCAEASFTTPAATTKADGSFEIIAADDQDFECLRASHPGYLSAQQSFPGQSLGSFTLPGGDANGDQVVDILDLAMIATLYRTNDPTGDINADGLVNIFDLVITASNYQERGPIIISLEE